MVTDLATIVKGSNMQQVFLIKTFKELVQAFEESRAVDDPVPSMERDARLQVDTGSG